MMMIVFFFLATLALTGRIFRLQVVEGHRHAWRSVAQRSLRYDYKPTGRGQILDRNGVSLLDTRHVPVHVFFEPLLDEETRQILANHTRLVPNRQVYAIADQYRLLRDLGDTPREGVVPAVEETRYGKNALAPHVTGYIQKSGASGPTGLERTFDDELSAGRPFSLAAFVDAHGNLIPGLGYRDLRGDDPRKPYDLVTTIDNAMQRIVETILARENKSAAVVLMEPKTGDILAMASYPQVKPWEMYSGVSSQRMQELQNDPRTPFINKAIQQYPPGSVFKVILAAAALETGMVGLQEGYVCSGSIEVGDTSISCFNGEAHGEVDLQRALTVSCNSYFVWLGQKLGRETITDTAAKFKLGKPTGIPLDERAGNIPAPEAMPFLGNLAHVSIGQGQILTTPLQLARVMAIISNDGLDVYPRLITEITDNSGRTVRRYPSYSGSRVLQPAAARRLKVMLADVVASGTGRSAQSGLYTAIGKTGTAETSRAGLSHSWFAGIVELNGKTLVATVFIEDRREGSATSVFRTIMEAL